MEEVDLLDESARAWGAVNTILFEAQDKSGEWKPLRMCPVEEIATIRSRGFNTDADAITRSIEEDLSMELINASVLLLGAGGAGRTAALKLAASGVKQLFLVNRTKSKAAEVATEIEKRNPGIEMSLEYPSTNIDLVLNATSLGLKPEDTLPFDTERFSLKKARSAYDMIYRPAQTPFLNEASRAGCKTANGLGMLLYQGAKALEIWSGKPAPIATMRNALHAHVYGLETE